MFYFISDLHFNHEKVLKYEKDARPFNSLEEMNEKLIENWNSRVKEEDTVYMLGDIFMGTIDIVDAIMPRLKGKKILIRGNHDTNKRVEKMKPYLVPNGVHSLLCIEVEKTPLVLCHYPIREWMWKDNGSIHLYGHVHSNDHRNGILQEPNSYHVGVDTNGLMPISFEEIMRKLGKGCRHDNVSDGRCKNPKCNKTVTKYIINNEEVYF